LLEESLKLFFQLLGANPKLRRSHQILSTTTNAAQPLPCMIRRNPTLIPMSDLDVQDVRDLVAKQKEEVLATQKTMQIMKRVAERPLDQGDVQMFLQLKDFVTARKEKEKEREVRLGLQPGPSGSASAPPPGVFAFLFLSF
jgi:hypothetical protein